MSKFSFREVWVYRNNIPIWNAKPNMNYILQSDMLPFDTSVVVQLFLFRWFDMLLFKCFKKHCLVINFYFGFLFCFLWKRLLVYRNYNRFLLNEKIAESGYFSFRTFIFFSIINFAIKTGGLACHKTRFDPPFFS